MMITANLKFASLMPAQTSNALILIWEPHELSKVGGSPLHARNDWRKEGHKLGKASMNHQQNNLEKGGDSMDWLPVL